RQGQQPWRRPRSVGGKRSSTRWKLRPQLLRAACTPYSERDVQALLDAMKVETLRYPAIRHRGTRVASAARRDGSRDRRIQGGMSRNSDVASAARRVGSGDCREGGRGAGG